MQLREAFRIIDINGDGILEPHELVQYLTNKGIEPDAAEQIQQEILLNIDDNGDGKIDIYEFADKYIEIVKALRMRQIETEDKMMEHYDHLKNDKQNIKLLQESKDDDPSQFTKQCMVNVISFRKLPPSMRKPYLKIYHVTNGREREVGSANSTTAENPVYNTKVQFEVF